MSARLREAKMFDDVVRASEALRIAAGQRAFRPLTPALARCRTCDGAAMIAAPKVSVCAGCGGDLVLLDRTSEGGASSQPVQAAA
jgi:hypothetical protein